ncbi:hypothetical protein JCM19274_2241 [Algibacter lectus]|uniref:Uncharacterized protein n=1 Tax=Algibacter lectus TaxID=221126 RepID=A0A090X6D0_9FLAO|nr:hypothetical protein JCM19274_2241 [Algibacter lectus]
MALKQTKNKQMRKLILIAICAVFVTSCKDEAKQDSNIETTPQLKV